jgi:DNA (cytosine-5)-methyltransferase 1
LSVSDGQHLSVPPASLQLDAVAPPRPVPGRPQLTIVDLYCGGGGLSLGAKYGIEQLGSGAKFLLGADRDTDALMVYRRNFHPALTTAVDIGLATDYQIATKNNTTCFLYPPEIIDECFAKARNPDLFLAGPPCQGHSNLNNHTRRDDPRNEHYLATVATAVALASKAIIIENVREVGAAKGDLLETATTLLEQSGYQVEIRNLDASTVGIAQTRRRCFLIAALAGPPPIDHIYDACRRAPVASMTVLESLIDCYGSDVYNTTARATKETQARINYLFEMDLYELPDELRPECHQEGHTYGSVYGRMRPDRPVGTLTQGFMTMGQGRFVHPTQPRCITPHEGARLQGIPDFFKFEAESGQPLTQRSMLKLIGNAVPPRLGEVATLAALQAGMAGEMLTAF